MGQRFLWLTMRMNSKMLSPIFSLVLQVDNEWIILFVFRVVVKWTRVGLGKVLSRLSLPLQYSLSRPLHLHIERQREKTQWLDSCQFWQHVLWVDSQGYTSKRFWRLEQVDCSVCVEEMQIIRLRVRQCLYGFGTSNWLGLPSSFPFYSHSEKTIVYGID